MSIRFFVLESKSQISDCRPLIFSFFSDSLIISNGISGILASPSVKALKYNPVPPTMIGRFLVFKIGTISRNQCPTEYDVQLSIWPYSEC